MALPVLLELCPEVVSGPVYCTLACLDVGRHMMRETQDVQHRLSSNISLTPAEATECALEAGPSMLGSHHTAQHESHTHELAQGRGITHVEHSHVAWQVSKEQQHVFANGCWSRLTSADAAEKAFSRVKTVRFGQLVEIDGVGMTATAYPAGSGLGHCLWVITDNSGNRLGYVSDLHWPESGCSKALEVSCLHKLNVLIAAPGCLTPGSETKDNITGPPQQSSSLVEKTVNQAVLQAVTSGGCALIPVTPSGLTYELIESVSRCLAAAGLSAGGGGQAGGRKQPGEALREGCGIPIFYVGCCALDSLALATTSMEFLNRSRQGKVYIPELPFPFDKLIADGRLVVAPSLSEPTLQARWREPCVVFVPAASMAAGPGKQLLNKWCPDPKSALIMVDGILGGAQCCSSMVAQLSIQHSLKLKVVRCPAGAGLRPEHLAGVLDASRPQHLLIWAADYQLLRKLPPTSRGVFATESVVEYGWLDRVCVSLPGSGITCTLPPRMLKSVRSPVSVGDHYMVGRLTCLMKHKNGSWQLEAVPHTPASNMDAIAMTAVAADTQACHRMIWGKPTLAGIMSALQQSGLSWLSLSVEEGGKAEGAAPIVGVPNQIGEAEGSGREVYVIKMDQIQAELRLAGSWAEIKADSAVARQIIYTCLAAQLNVV
eukprot:gene30015-18091_t